MKRIISVLNFVIILGVIVACAQENTQWRGDKRDGVYPSKNLMKTWPEKGPSLLWSVETIGNGYGSPAIVNDWLYVNGEINNISHVFAFNTKGELLWKAANGNEFSGNGYSANFPGSRSTPTLVGDHLYACSGNGRIACYDAKTGAEKWATDMITDLKGIMCEFGYAESVLIDGEVLYCFPGGKTNNVVALNRLTGKVIWTSKALGDTVSYCSSQIIHLSERDVLMGFTSHYFLGLDAKTGELLWSQKQENVKYMQQCNTPVYDNGYIYYVAGDGNGAVKLALSADGKSINQVWRNDQVRNNFNGFVKIGNDIFCTDFNQKLKRIDGNSGKVIDSLRVVKGAIIAADDMLYCYSDNGTVNLVNYNGGKMEIAGKLKIEKGSKEHFSHPVIDKGVMYIRHGNALMAYNIGNE